MFNAVTGQDDAPAGTVAVTRWTAKGTFTATSLQAESVKEALTRVLKARGWSSVVVTTSNNGADGWFPTPAQQTFTATVIPGTGSKSKADLETDVRAAVKQVDPGILGALAIWGDELKDNVARPTVDDAADLAHEAIDQAGGFVWKAIPWWVWLAAGGAVLVYVLTQVSTIARAFGAARGGDAS